jgi:hypothetical protein
VEEQVAIRQSTVWATIQALLPKPVDCELALLLLEGVRETLEFASVLGITELPASEQEFQVKRHKDRIKKMLQRHINRSELDETS